jgi:hypothetical protein
MPRLPGWAWLSLPIGFVSLATYMARGYLKRQVALHPPETKTAIVVAKRGIDPASRVSPAQFQTGVWHQEKAPQGLFGSVAQVKERVAALIMPGGFALAQ